VKTEAVQNKSTQVEVEICKLSVPIHTQLTPRPMQERSVDL